MMEKEKDKHLGLRIDPETHRKLRYIADYDGRSINKQVIHLIHECIRDFECEHGRIGTDDDRENP